MTFLEILPRLMSGDRIRKRKWKEGVYIYVEDVTVVLNDGSPVGDYFVHWCKKNSDDWELFEEPNDYIYTEEEIKALKYLYSLDGKLIARNKYGELYVYTVESLLKNDIYWYHCQLYIGSILEESTIKIRKELFPNIKWEDTKPLSIKEELKRIGELKC